MVNRYFGSQLNKGVICFFLMHLDTPIHRDLLIDKLWQDHDYKRPNTSSHMYFIHKKMLESFHPDHTLSFAGQHYTLHLEEAWCDVVILDICQLTFFEI